MRKLAREAVIFMLLGPVVVFLVVFSYSQKQSVGGIRGRAAQSIFAVEANRKLRPEDSAPPNTVLVPLTNGTALYVVDCSQLHPWDVVNESPAKNAKRSEIQAGSASSDCMLFKDEFFQKFGGHVTAVPLGEENQVAIEKQYWAAYAQAKRELRGESALVAGYLSIYGFPGGLVLWGFYRLIRFAVKG